MSLIDFENPSGMIMNAVWLLVGILFLVAAAPLVFTGFTNISTISGFYFSSLFASGGVVYIAFSAAILIAILGLVLAKNKR